jgi:hypothetical protein
MILISNNKKFNINNLFNWAIFVFLIYIYIYIVVQ